MWRPSLARSRVVELILMALLATSGTLPAFALEVHRFDIPEEEAATAIRDFGEQAHVQILVAGEAVKGKRLHAVTGQLSTEDGLNALLSGSGLTHQYVGDHSIALLAAQATAASTQAQGSGGAGSDPKEGNKSSSRDFRVAQVDQGASSADSSVKTDADTANRSQHAEPEVGVGLPEVVVIGSKILNMDIKRSRDDAQPYVIFDRAAIEQSGATDIEDFLKQRLTANTQSESFGQFAAVQGSISQINLRGLGTNQTLILVDGHRTASPVNITGPLQSSLNGIPLDAVERIEVLPTTASGIYGGGATGGVVNVVLRRDYAGAELKASYENSFDSDSGIRRFDLSAGVNLEGGKTNIMLAASYSDANMLPLKDRDFLQRGRAAILANNPAALLSFVIPPLGATTNIRSLNGSPLFGPGTPNFTSVPAGYAGGGGLAPLQANAGQYDLDPANSASTIPGGSGGNLGLVNAPTLESFSTTLRRQFSPNVQAFIEAGGSKNVSYFLSNMIPGIFIVGANAPNNPFGQAVRVTVPVPQGDGVVSADQREERLVGGVILRLPRTWTAEADYTWDRFKWSYVRNSTLQFFPAFSAVSSGALDVLRDTTKFPVDFSPYLNPPSSTQPFDSTLKDATVRLSGPLWRLPGGDIVLTGLLEHRDELFGSGVLFANPTISFFYPSMSQAVDSVYLEARIPLISAHNEITGAQELELQVAGRRDEYRLDGADDTGVPVGTPVALARNKSSSTNPTLGLRYRPLTDLLLRASYGTGFLPPSVQQIVPNAPVTFSGNTFVDPMRGNEVVTQPVTFQGGGNSTLRPETSHSWSTGLVLAPRKIPGARLSVDYTHIDKTDNITTLTAQQTLDNESVLPGRVTRGPVPANDPFGVGPITGIDLSLVNISRALVDAYDVELDYRTETARFGTFDFFALATWETHYKTQIAPTTAVIENVGIGNYDPVRFKSNAGLTWESGPWALGWTARYFASYLAADPALDPTTNLNQGNGGRVPSQIYHDLFARYRLPSARSGGTSFASKALSGTEVSVGIKNVFNHEPPFDAGQLQQYYSPFGDPRLRVYYVSAIKRF